jgi:hypothetical protein
MQAISNTFLVYFLPTSNIMVDTMWIGLDWIDAGQAREDQNKVTEEAVKRVQDQAKQAKKVRDQWKKEQKQNTKIAQFLTFLLREIKNEKLLKVLHTLFFKVKNPKDNVFYVRKSINATVLAWFFVPFYANKAYEIWLEDFFWKLYPHKSKPNITTYIQYLKKLSAQYHDNIPLDKKLLLELVFLIIREYQLKTHDQLTNEKDQIIQKIEKELYYS